MSTEVLCAKAEALARDARFALEWLRGYAARGFEETSLSDRLAARYNVIALVEALAGLAYVAAKILGHEEPQGYVDALVYLARVTGLEEYAPLMRALARLRNLLVHRYWVVDDARLHSELGRDLSFVERVLERIWGVLSVCRATKD